MTDILDTIEELDDDDFEYVDDEVDSVEGEVVNSDDVDDYEMNERQAQEITEAIRSAATATYILLAQAHKHKAYKALGYDTWADYINEEFDMSAQRSYQLLDLSRAIELIEDSTPEGTEVKLTEAQARDIKRELPKITEQIKEETKGLSPEDAAEVAESIIEDAREQKKAEEKAAKEKAKALEDAETEGYQAGLEAAADAMLEADRPDGMTDIADDGLIEVDVDGLGTEDAVSPEDSMNLYNFFNMLTSISSLPEPDDFIEIVPSSRFEEINNQLMEATAWLNRFATLYELRQED